MHSPFCIQMHLHGKDRQGTLDLDFKVTWAWHNAFQKDKHCLMDEMFDKMEWNGKLN